MNTTMNSSSFGRTSGNFGDSTMRESKSKFMAPPQISEKQFYLFSPSNVQLANKAKGRYDNKIDIRPIEIESQPSQPSQPTNNQASIINLHIETNGSQLRIKDSPPAKEQQQERKSVKRVKGNQVNLVYVNHHEKQLQ